MSELEKNLRPLADIHDVWHADVDDTPGREQTFHPAQFGTGLGEMFEGVVKNDEIEPRVRMRFGVPRETSFIEIEVVEPFRRLDIHGGELDALDLGVRNFFLDEMQQRAEPATDIQHPDA